MAANSDDRLKGIFQIFIIFLIVLCFYLLSIFSTIIVPLAFAFLLASFFQPLIFWLAKKKVPKIIIFPLITMITLGFLSLLYTILYNSATQVVEQSPELLQQLYQRVLPLAELFSNFIKIFFGVNINDQDAFTQILQKINLSLILGNTFDSITSFTGSFFWFSIYFSVFLIGLPNYANYLGYVAGRKADSASLIKVYERIQKQIYKYILLKVFVAFLSATVVYVVCFIFNIKFSFLWAFLTFILSFIPYIGAITGVILPSLMAIIQFDSPFTILLFITILTGKQQLIGNIFEPILMGHSLRINTITAMFGLVFWGYLWGVSGLFLGIPFLVILKLVLERFPETEVMARVMGYAEDEKGKKLKNWRIPGITDDHDTGEYSDKEFESESEQK
ncbi:MAG: AI-2E family transporter [Ignavibacteriaceae bacterium]|nr:AI-2E family transporter [Ignavibacteriaceae bacterium]NUM70337.1 AI-2E family transporter [Ignavibacteriaceae bacterium]